MNNCILNHLLSGPNVTKIFFSKKRSKGVYEIFWSIAKSWDPNLLICWKFSNYKCLKESGVFIFCECRNIWPQDFYILWRFMSLHYISSNNSKKERKILVSLTGTNHGNSKLSRNIQFGKDVKVKRSYFGGFTRFL